MISRQLHFVKLLMKKLVIFDLDGTLLDTIIDYANSINYALKHFKCTTYAIQDAKLLVGSGAAVAISCALGIDKIAFSQQALSLQRQYYQQHNSENCFVYDGILQTLQFLKQNGVIVAVHTNKDHSIALQLCNKFFGNLVDHVCGTQSDSLTKPNPTTVLKLMEKYSLLPQEVVYVGDSDVDVTTARNAGVQCIAVTWGYRSKQVLIDAGAQTFAHSPQELQQKLSSL